MKHFSLCNRSKNAIRPKVVAGLQKELKQRFPDADAMLMERGVSQAAALWTADDGSEEEFSAFVRENYCATPAERVALFESLSRILENCYQSADMLTVDLLKPTQLTNAGEPQLPDWIMSAYSPLAHFSDDMFANKLAFVTILNFPHFSLDEKNTMGRHWSRQQWAMARLGDVFTTRVPASVNAALAQANADAENYIADYNIYMGNLRTEDGRKLWPEDKILLSHWNLRDELKALYADKEAGNEKQEMIFQVMQRIVRQDIPAKAVNGADYVWKPYSTQDSPENFKRYERILAIAHALFEEDKFCPAAPTGIQRNFEVGVEITAAELDSLFRALVGSEQVQQVAAIIRERLGRDLRPYDIWYDGFKARASLNEDELTALTRKLYPDANVILAENKEMTLSEETDYDFLQPQLQELEPKQRRLFTTWMDQWIPYVKQQLSPAVTPKKRDCRQELELDNILPIPPERNYVKVREYIIERCKYDKNFEKFYKSHKMTQFCDQLSLLFDWYVDSNALGKRMKSKPKK